MTSLDDAAIEVEVQIDVEEVEVHAEVVDVFVTLLSNTGPPGPQGETGSEGPMNDELPAHIDSELPHPVYDDGASFTLLYDNAKV